jgi:hypothetical protein
MCAPGARRRPSDDAARDHLEVRLLESLQVTVVVDVLWVGTLQIVHSGGTDGPPTFTM